MKKSIAFLLLLMISLEINSEAVLKKEKHENPWGRYNEFIKLLSDNRSEIIDKIYYPEVCESVIDELIQNKMTLINPKKVLFSNDELVEFVNANTSCEDFKVENIEYIAGSQHLLFKIEPPYYVYMFDYDKSSYIGIMPSGAASPDVPKTPSVVDFEGVTAPYIELLDSNQCIKVGGASVLTSQGEFGFGLVLSPSFGLLSYDYYFYDYKGKKISLNLSVVPALKKERKKLYCAAPNIKNNIQGE